MVDRGSAIFMCQNVYQKLAKKFARTKNNQIFMHKYIKTKRLCNISCINACFLVDDQGLEPWAH